MLRLLSDAKLIALTCTLAMCAMLVAFRSAPANDQKELKAQAEALLAKSQGLSNIEASGSPAFVLNMKIHYQIGAQSMDGQGQIIWLAPDHYREAYAAPNYSYTGIVRDGYHYLARTKNETPLAIYELQRTLQRAFGASPIKNEKIKQVETSQFGGQSLTCVTFSDKSTFKRCLTSDGDVATMEFTAPPSTGVLNERYEFSEFIGFGKKRFPQRLVFRRGNDYAIEIEVQQLAEIKEAPAGAFAAPVDAVKETWCAEPKTSSPSGSAEEMDAFSPGGDMTIVPPSLLPFVTSGATIYLVIGPNGLARAVTIIHSTLPIGPKDVQSLMKNTHFPIVRCGHNAIEYQAEMSFGR